jgi:hypothetical protein
MLAQIGGAFCESDAGQQHPQQISETEVRQAAVDCVLNLLLKVV